jgi:hypothetical protein
LLIYDNVERPEDLAGLLPPDGDGQVLITSRWSAWSDEADPIQLDVLDRAESVRYLQHRIRSGDPVRLGELADLVGDLPLALAEIAGYVEQTRIELGEYLNLLQGRARELFGMAGVGSTGLSAGEADRRRVATVWSVSLDEIRARAASAESLMTLFAFLAPAIPRTLPGEHPEALPEPLAEVVADPLAYNAALRVLGEFSMVALDPTTLVVHRLVQAVVRARLDPVEEQAWAERAIDLLRATFPDESREVHRWPECERLLPHLVVGRRAWGTTRGRRTAVGVAARPRINLSARARSVPPSAPPRPTRACRHPGRPRA